MREPCEGSGPCLSGRLQREHVPLRGQPEGVTRRADRSAHSCSRKSGEGGRGLPVCHLRHRVVHMQPVRAGAWRQEVQCYPAGLWLKGL